MVIKKFILTVLVLFLILISFQNVYSGSFSNKNQAEIKISGQADLNRLIRLKLIIDNVNNCIVRAYISPDEFNALAKAGFILQWIPEYSNKRKSPPKEGELSYPTYNELVLQIYSIADSYPDICHIESAGQSVQKRELWWIKISDNVESEEAEPEVHYISTMHGDEPLGTTLCLELIKYLTQNYASDSRIKKLINNTEIWIMPLMNPDGYEADKPDRMNANGADLNRSFPDTSSESHDTFNSTKGRQPEVIAIMDWSFKHSPVLSANFHTGALVVNYPFDYTHEFCPDNDLFEYISLEYSRSNPSMFNTNNPSSAINGIVQGSDWYQMKGGMQDWAYFATGGNQVTIELSSVKEPDVSKLSDLWEDNRESMIAYLETVHCGIKGIVTDKDTGEPLFAWIRVDEIDHCVYTDPEIGDYHRMLLPGNYRMIVRAKGYQSYSQNITIEDGITLEQNILLKTNSTDNGGCFIITAAEYLQ